MATNSGRSNNLDNLAPAKALLTIRIIWAALILGQIAFMCVVGIILSQPAGPNVAVPPVNQPMIFLIINVAMLLTAVPATFMVRMTTHRRNRNEDGTIKFGAYAVGNIIFWAGCEGCSFFGLIVALIDRNFWPTILIVAIVMSLQAATFPRRGSIEASGGTFKLD